MAKKRKKLPDHLSYHHLMSRTVNGEVLFGEVEKEVFRKMIWKVAEFSGVRVITYAVMNNHFHLLVEVPEKAKEVSDEELVRRYRLLYPQPTPWQPMKWEVLEQHLKANLGEGRQLREELLSRMHDVSEFMKTLKLRYSLWFNRTHERFGPLWSARFKSLLVEGESWALRMVAAYIDLNAVRAGLVTDPKDYRFCGYGEAVGGGQLAQKGLAVLDRSLSGYRQTLFGVGVEEKDGKMSISPEEASQVLKAKGKLPLAVLLRGKVLYFVDGMILGSESFVKEQLAKDPPGKREPKAHPMEGGNWRGLAVAKGIRKKLFG